MMAELRITQGERGNLVILDYKGNTLPTGEISIESVPEKGTMVIIEIPLSCMILGDGIEARERWENDNKALIDKPGAWGELKF